VALLWRTVPAAWDEGMNEEPQSTPALAALAKQIAARSHLHGNFRLRSGQTSDEYFDKYQFEADPRLLDSICNELCRILPDGEVLAGLELGGIPIATVLSQKTGLPVCFVRKKAKEYGTCRLAEGAAIENRRVIIVEDVVTS
jgi:orotate phosphoribosyltransferase